MFGFRKSFVLNDLAVSEKIEMWILDGQGSDEEKLAWLFKPSELKKKIYSTKLF